MAVRLRVAETDADLEAWRSVRIAALPNERCATVEWMRASLTPERVHLLAELDGELAGSGLAGCSDLGGAGLHPRVLPAFGRRGVGTAILAAGRGPRPTRAPGVRRHGHGPACRRHARPVGAGWLASPEAILLALVDGAIVGCAGLELDRDERTRAENALTAVLRAWRGRGIAGVLEWRALTFAAANGVDRVYTWTQQGNAAMRRLNEGLGYVAGAESITVRAPLPLPSDR